MSLLPVNSNPADSLEQFPEWFVRLGLCEPERCAQKLAESLHDDPFHIIGFTAIAAARFGCDFAEVIDLLASSEPTLRTALTELAAALSRHRVSEGAAKPSAADRQALPKWLREFDKLEVSGVMRRYEYDDRTASTYLIEVRLLDGQVATGRLSIRHGDVDTISEFWTTAMSLSEAARFYRKRYTLATTRPYRRVKPKTAGPRILEALAGSVLSGRFLEDLDAPIPWPQNMSVLNLMLQPMLAKSQS